MVSSDKRGRSNDRTNVAMWKGEARTGRLDTLIYTVWGGGTDNTGDTHNMKSKGKMVQR